MPVIKHYHGVCHVYVDEKADLDMAVQIVINAKTQRPGVCNALETLLVHESVADKFLKNLAPALRQKGVAVYADPAAFTALEKLEFEPLDPAKDDTWTMEYLDLILSVKVVKTLDEAVEHIEHYGSHHSDAIITREETTAQRFLAEVDSATVFWNASTRFQ